jgi:hypothetical protein
MTGVADVIAPGGVGDAETVNDLRTILADLAEMPPEVRNQIALHATHFREYLASHSREPGLPAFMALALVGAEIAAGELTP